MRTRLIILTLIIASSLGVDAREKKNLLFIITDQQRSDALSIAGNTVLETPNLDRLAKQGAWFKNAYSACAVCAPARSSILTGRTVENTGMRRNDRAYFYDEEEVMTMPTFDEVLSENGYHCEYYGKWHSQSSHTSIYKNPKQLPHSPAAKSPGMGFPYEFKTLWCSSCLGPPWVFEMTCTIGAP